MCLDEVMYIKVGGVVNGVLFKVVIEVKIVVFLVLFDYICCWECFVIKKGVIYV